MIFIPAIYKNNVKYSGSSSSSNIDIATTLTEDTVSDTSVPSSKAVYSIVDNLQTELNNIIDDNNEINNNLSNIIQIKQGYFGINGTSTSWTQHTSYPQTYQYPYKFPDVDGYKFVIGFTLLGWTNNNVYHNYILRTTATTTQEGKTELYSGDGTPDTVIYYIGLYIKSV